MSPSCHFGMHHQGLAVATLTCPSYVDGRKREATGNEVLSLRCVSHMTNLSANSLIKVLHLPVDSGRSPHWHRSTTWPEVLPRVLAVHGHRHEILKHISIDQMMFPRDMRQSDDQSVASPCIFYCINILLYQCYSPLSFTWVDGHTMSDNITLCWPHRWL